MHCHWHCSVRSRVTVTELKALHNMLPATKLTSMAFFEMFVEPTQKETVLLLPIHGIQITPKSVSNKHQRPIHTEGLQGLYRF